jgi:hypothetical protein
MPYTNAPVMTKAQLHSLKDDVSETKQELTLKDAERIDTFVNAVYRKVLDIAENTAERKSISKVYSEYIQFYSEHLQEILCSLRLRLPDSKVESKVLVYDTSGNLHEPEDSSFHRALMNTYIVIDWS